MDHCRPSAGGSNFQVQLDGVWQGICCVGGDLVLSDADCTWWLDDRILTDLVAGQQLDCPEGGPTDCHCDAVGEHMHGTERLGRAGGGVLNSDYLEDTCVVVASDGSLVTDWTGASCPNFRLR
ncbi:MAG: hypothetical protein R3F59_25275 [Myxococcota bacterium]